MTSSRPSTFHLVDQAASHDIPIEDEKGLPDLGIDLIEHKLQYEVDTLRQQLQEAIDNHALRKGYANKIFWLVCIWLSCVILALLFSGLHAFEFVLSDNVLITFIASTTLNVTGLFAIVAKWMFQQNGKESDKK